MFSNKAAEAGAGLGGRTSCPAAPRGSRSRFGGPPVVLRPVPAAGTWRWGATFLDTRTSFSVSST